MGANSSSIEWMLSRTKHGAWLGGEERPEHYVWRSMLARCQNPNRKDYHNYGGRGITVCPEWLDYCRFCADMGPRPSLRHTLDRVKNDEGYSKSNCRWATRKEQANNRRNNKRIGYYG